jgi:hypothetical protein
MPSEKPFYNPWHAPQEYHAVEFDYPEFNNPYEYVSMKRAMWSCIQTRYIRNITADEIELWINALTKDRDDLEYYKRNLRK